MGRKQTRAGKHIYFCFASLIFLSILGCGTIQDGRKRVDARAYLDHGHKLLSEKNYEGALSEYQETLSLSTRKPPEDEALFSMGLIYAHPGNPKKDFRKSIIFFKKLLEDYPQSPWVGQAKIWIEMLQENERLTRSIEELNQVIKKSKQVDIEIEKKRRERAR